MFGKDPNCVKCGKDIKGGRSRSCENALSKA